MDPYVPKVYTNYGTADDLNRNEQATSDVVSLANESAARLDALEAATPTDPDPTTSGEAMPTTDLAGWELVFTDDFDEAVPVGSWPSQVAEKWNHYPSDGTFKDTSKNGTYDSLKCVRVENNRMHIRMFTEVGTSRAITASAATNEITLASHGFKNLDKVRLSSLTGGAGLTAGTYFARDITTNTFRLSSTASGSAIDITTDMTAGQARLIRHNVACPVPRVLGLPGASTASNSMLYGRYAVRFRVTDEDSAYKLAWLLWPQSGVWPRDGEIDFPECNLGFADLIKGFMHRQGATSGGDQDERNSGVALGNGTWHTCVLEWGLNRCAFYLDGALIGSIVTVAVPNTPMWKNMQSETALSGGPPTDVGTAEVEVDWVAVWKPATVVTTGFVKAGGSSAVKTPTDATLEATVPAGGHTVGRTIVVAVTSQSGGPVVSGVSDSRGNTYTQIEASNLWASVLTTALQAGDTITATFASIPGACVIITNEYAGISVTEDVAGASAFSGAPGTAPTVSITPTTAATLMLGMVRENGPVENGFTADTDTTGGVGWTTTRIGTTGAGINTTVSFAHKLTTSAAAQTINPTLGASVDWKAIIASLRKI